MGSTVLWLFGESLQSKWGFNDGDMPEVVWDELEERGLVDVAVAVDWHTVLRSLVREFLVPLITPPLEVYDIETIHNPIRTDDERDLDGADVAVPIDVVVDRCRSVADQ